MRTIDGSWHERNINGTDIIVGSFINGLGMGDLMNHKWIIFKSKFTPSNIWVPYEPPLRIFGGCYYTHTLIPSSIKGTII